MLKITTDSSALDAALDTFAQKMQCIVIISGAAAAAREFYDEAKARVPRKSELLHDSIYRVLSKDNTGDGKATYHISWNKKKAPHGHLIEFGTSRAPAYPFMRPAYDAARPRAIEAAKKRMSEVMRDD